MTLLNVNKDCLQLSKCVRYWQLKLVTSKSTVHGKSVYNKKESMKIQFTLFLLILLGLFSCSTDDVTPPTFADDPSLTTLNGRWKVTSFEDHETGMVELSTAENSWGKDIVITFDDTADPNMLSGVNATNAVQGEFRYLSERTFRIDTFLSTYMAEPQWSSRFTKAIVNRDVNFQINPQQLRLFYDNNRKSITLKRQ